MGPGAGIDMGQTCESQRQSNDVSAMLFVEMHRTLPELSYLDASGCRVLYNNPTRKALPRVHFTDDDTVTQDGYIARGPAANQKWT